MLLRYSSRLLALLLTVQLLLCGWSLAKTQPQKLTGCHNITKTDEDGVILYYFERSNPQAPHVCTRYAWSTVGYPTLFISQDNSSCECKYDLNKEEYTNSSKPGPPHSVNITGKNFSLAIVFMRLIEFTVDTKKANSYTVFNVTKHCDTSDIMSKVELNSSELVWNLTTDKSTLAKENKDYALTASMKADNDSNFNFKINTHFPNTAGFERLPHFPKPQISENATLVDIIFQNFHFKLTGGDDDDDDLSSRLALEMLIVHGSQVQNGSSSVHKYLDDEYTPSVFSSWTYGVQGKAQVLKGYLHWKPISYENSARKSTASQQINVLSAGNDSRCNISDLPAGLATALFGDRVDPANVSNVTRWFAVFGTDGDDSNLSPSYATWTLVVGYGTVPEDKLSFVVIITIIVGLGVPGVLVIAGGVYVFIKKKPWQRFLAGRGAYQTLQ